MYATTCRVPFYANFDDSHCFQCVIRSVLKVFYPEEEYSWSQIDKLTGKRGDLWTWPLETVIRLREKGMCVELLEDFDYGDFAQIGEKYLLERFGTEVTEIQVKHSDIPYEQANARLVLKLMQPQATVPTLDDLSWLLEQGYLVVCNVNSMVLNRKAGYAGHFVLVYAFDGKTLRMHDPGRPPFPDREVPAEEFLKAWEYPTERDKNLLAFRKV